jgi:hypothetical protein
MRLFHSVTSARSARHFAKESVTQTISRCHIGHLTVYKIMTKINTFNSAVVKKGGHWVVKYAIVRDLIQSKLLDNLYINVIHKNTNFCTTQLYTETCQYQNGLFTHPPLLTNSLFRCYIEYAMQSLQLK